MRRVATHEGLKRRYATQYSEIIKVPVLKDRPNVIGSLRAPNLSQGFAKINRLTIAVVFSGVRHLTISDSRVRLRAHAHNSEFPFCPGDITQSLPGLLAGCSDLPLSALQVFSQSQGSTPSGGTAPT